MNTPSSTLPARRRLRLPAKRGSVAAWPSLVPTGQTDSSSLPAPVSALDSRFAENRSIHGGDAGALRPVMDGPTSPAAAKELALTPASVSKEPGSVRIRENRIPDRKQRFSSRLFGSEAGMATAEYAIATLAAVGLAGLLVVILRSEEVRGFLLNLIRTALSLP
ncbi:DUF4244 domain-containing protein [Paenarthrobacter sp. NPDC089675]|uniref:DUF4244 domain-containing protein n=1 Tax=Paenarthrobacter sp. NPDC089675 TaxID=3364376 RepID=UPI003822CD9A